ncbi:hypothetical protein CB1_001170004 [Camelus ferus]|nr:hypothetical protein CB1_001170004 [Camelus ferus]
MDTSYIFPQGVLVIITLIGGVVGFGEEPKLMLCVRQDFLFGPWLLLPCQGQGLLSRYWNRHLRVRLDQAPFPFSAALPSKEVIAEASEVRVLPEDQCTACLGICGSTQKQPRVASLTLLCHPRSSARLWCGVGGVRGWGIMAARFEVAVLSPEIWAASVAVFSQDLPAPDPELSFVWSGQSQSTHSAGRKIAGCSCGTTRVGKFDCASAPDVCSNLYVFQPCLAVFKGQGTKEFEIHHGKKILYDILAFAKESVNSHVTTLGPQNFPANDKEPWLVDFFAPWCPPCRALLPELRKASKHLYGQLKFGTLDCTVHEGLCNMYNIQAYPTTVVFNQSSVHEYEGHHSAEQILEFVEMIKGKVKAGKVDCQAYAQTCQKAGIRAYPTVRFYPYERAKVKGNKNSTASEEGWRHLAS